MGLTKFLIPVVILKIEKKRVDWHKAVVIHYKQDGGREDENMIYTADQKMLGLPDDELNKLVGKRGFAAVRIEHKDADPPGQCQVIMRLVGIDSPEANGTVGMSSGSYRKLVLEES